MKFDLSLTSTPHESKKKENTETSERYLDYDSWGTDISIYIIWCLMLYQKISTGMKQSPECENLWTQYQRKASEDFWQGTRERVGALQTELLLQMNHCCTKPISS